MRFRHQRGGLSESLATTVDVVSVDELVTYLNLSRQLVDSVSKEDLTIKPYGEGAVITARGNDDERIGWKNVHMVSDRHGPIGFLEVGDATLDPARKATP